MDFHKQPRYYAVEAQRVPIVGFILVQPKQSSLLGSAAFQVLMDWIPGRK